MRNLAASRVTLAAAVILALGALFGVATLSRPAALAAGGQSASARSATVTSAVRACPLPGQGGAEGRVAMIAASASAGSGQAQLIPLTAEGSVTPPAATGSAAQPGQLSLPAIPATSRHARAAPTASSSPAASTGTGTASRSASNATTPNAAVMIQASGSMAQGLEAEQTDSTGLATARCDGPGTDFWFAGTGQASAASIRLYLMNVDGQAADADVDIYTEAGLLPGSTDTGIAVPPYGVVVQSLASLVRGSHVVALHVRTSVGRLVAAVSEGTGGGQGGSWLPAARAPAAQVVIPGIPRTPGSLQLYVVVPGGSDAQIKVTAVTPQGTYEPTGAGGIDVPSGSAAAFTLPALTGTVSALRITSNVPVTAAALVPGNGIGAFSAAAGPLEQQGVVAGNSSRPGDLATIVLSAPGRVAAQVRITPVGFGSGASAASAAGQTIAVPAGRSVAVKVRLPAGSKPRSAFAVVVTPLAGSGPVYAARVLAAGGAGGTVQSIIPVTSALTWIPLSPVRDSLSTVVP